MAYFFSNKESAFFAHNLKDSEWRLIDKNLVNSKSEKFSFKGKVIRVLTEEELKIHIQSMSITNCKCLGKRLQHKPPHNHIFNFLHYANVTTRPFAITINNDIIANGEDLISAANNAMIGNDTFFYFA